MAQAASLTKLRACRFDKPALSTCSGLMGSDVFPYTDDALCARLAGTPLRRAAPVRLKRNAAIVLGNLGDPAGRPALERALAHPSETVQSHARWALDRLG